MTTLATERSRIERAMFDPSSAQPPERDCTMSDLMKRHADTGRALEEAEQVWLAASEALEAAMVNA